MLRHCQTMSKLVNYYIPAKTTILVCTLGLVLEKDGVSTQFRPLTSHYPLDVKKCRRRGEGVTC